MAKTAELKTKVNNASVTEFLNNVEDEQKRKDCLEIARMMEQVTKEQPKMWGTSIVGFGSYHYKGRAGAKVTGCSSAFHPANKTLHFTSCPASNDIRD